LGLVLASCLPTGARAAASAAPDQPYRAPYLPTADAEVLQQVPAATDPKVREMRALRVRLDAQPHDLGRVIALATAYIGYGRQIGDAHYAGYAEAVLAPWLSQKPPPLAVLDAYATILQYRHQFQDARARLQEVLHRDPKDPQALLTLATLDMVQGDYAAASRGCAQVATAAGYEFGIACSASVLSCVGRAQQGMTMLTLIEGTGASLTDTFKAWVEGLMAEGAERVGDWAQAETHYRQALSQTPQDNFLLVAYADFLLDRGRPQEVLTLLADHAQSDTAFLRLALAQSALHSPDLPRYVWIMSARFEALVQRGSDYFGREQARFALQLQHDPQTALQLARQNWTVQREPWDTRILLESALAAHQPEAAAAALAFVARSKLQDPAIDALVKQFGAASPNRVNEASR
jgi:tetratricopeptide (TPR) repeat protein